MFRFVGVTAAVAVLGLPGAALAQPHPGASGTYHKAVCAAEPGLVAVHVLVPSEDVWRLLPKLEAAGGSSILILPVERMAA